MPKLLLFFCRNLLLCLLLGSFAVKAASDKRLYDQLKMVNKNWQKIDVNSNPLLGKPVEFISEQELLKTHLRLVEGYLRKSDTSHLSEKLLQARKHHLDQLHHYWTKKQSPRNYILPYRNPVFIDQQNRICAVGYLLKQSGAYDLALHVAKTNNTIYVKEIQSAAFESWIINSGMKKEELAWIQPGYSPEDAQQWEPMGKSGIAGEIKAVAIDESSAAKTLFVGGRFLQAGTNKKAQNIAVFDGKTWQNLNKGVNGEVNSLIIGKGYLYVGGQFSRAGAIKSNNLAKWDIQQKIWKNLDKGLTGTVTAMAFFNQTLFASTKKNPKNPEHILYKLEDSSSSWQQVATFNHSISSIIEYGDQLFIAGEFTQLTQENQILKADYIISYADNQWHQLPIFLKEPVWSTAIFKGRLILGTRHFEKIAEDSDSPPQRLIAKIPVWDGRNWASIVETEYFPIDKRNKKKPNKIILAQSNDSLIIGDQQTGRISYIVSDSLNTFETQPWMGHNLTGLQKINCIQVMNSQIFMGGVADDNKKNYIGSPEFSFTPNSSVLKYYKLRSGINLINFSNTREDLESMYTPLSYLRGEKNPKSE